MKMNKTILTLITCLINYISLSAQSGTLDSSFGTNGIVVTDIGGKDYARSVAIQSDGKIVAAGSSRNDVALVRYKVNGSIDSTFGTHGKVITDLGSNSDNANDVVIQSDGKILVVGHSSFDFALVRYKTNGSLDSTFGNGGKVKTDIRGEWDFANSVAIQADGKIMVAGSSENDLSYDFSLLRYKINGKLDRTFGSRGKVRTDIGGNSDESFSVALQSDGKIVMVGSSWAGSNEVFALVRYNANGSLDGTFGNNGIVLTDLGAKRNSAHSVVLQSDGKIVVLGNRWIYTDFWDYALVRYNTDGSIDSTFGNQGIVLSDDESKYFFIFSLALQVDGKIVAVGSRWNNSKYDFSLLRYNTDGNLDSTFGTLGKVTTDVGGENKYASAVTLQSDGKIVVVGWYLIGSSSKFVIARYKN